MNLVILSPEKEIFKGEVKSVKVPGTTGQFEVLSNHEAIVSSLRAGEVRVIDAQGNRTVFDIKGGFIEVLNNQVSVAVD